MSWLAGIVAATALALPGASAQEEWPELRPLEVTVVRVDGIERATVACTNASVERVVARLAEQTGRRLTGFSTDQPGTALVTVELRDRPLRQVLEYLLGGVGLDYEFQDDLLRVVPRESGAVERLEARALAHYLRASRSFPDHPDASRARLAQGEIETRRGNLAGAVDHYRALLDDHPLSLEVPAAHLAAALVLEQLGRFEEAHAEYLELTRLEIDDARRRAARLGLARCQLELSNPSFAILMLRRLNESEPAGDRIEQAARLLLEARALSRAGMHIETLEVLDQLERLGPAADTALQAMRVRAVALEGLDFREPAARAWLTIARRLDDEQRDAAYLRAAELTLASGSELGVLLIAGEARASGGRVDLEELVREARLGLGLTVDLDPSQASVEARLHVARADLAEGRTARARRGLEDLFAERETLDDELLVQVAVALADLRRSEAPSKADGLEQAARTLAEARLACDPEVAAVELDSLAAEMFENARDFERAAAAWEGRY